MSNITIRETRRLTIKGRIITLESVLILAKILERERQNFSDDGGAELTFFASCTDNSTFSSNKIELFEENSPLTRKRVSYITIEFAHYKTKSRIQIGLVHGNGSYGNEVTISGTDSNWVNGILRVIEETIDSFTPQNTFLHQNDRIIRTVFSFGVGLLYLQVIVRLIPATPIAETPGWDIKLNLALSEIPLGHYLFKYVLAFLIGLFPSEVLYNKLKSWWPSVELQIGPEHTLTEKQRRKWIANAVIFGVLPLAASLIYDVIKAFYTHNG